MDDQLLKPPEINPETQRMIEALMPEYLKQNNRVVDPSSQPGKIPSVGPNGLEYAPFASIDMLGNVAGAGAKAVGAGLKGAIFAGPLATNAPVKAYDMARAMLLGAKKEPRVGTLMPGVDDSIVRHLWGKYGLSPGMEGRMVHEIQDHPLKIPPFEHPNFRWGTGKLGDAVEHPELFKEYPWLQDLRLNLKKGEEGGGLSANVEKPNEPGIVNVSAPTYDKARQVMGHELQHVVQWLEGRPHGSNNVSIFKAHLPEKLRAANTDEQHNALADKAFDLYKRVSGEQEATNVMTRMQGHQYMTPPWLTEDTTRANQLVPHHWLSRQPKSTQVAFEQIPNLANQPGVNDLTMYRLLLGK